MPLCWGSSKLLFALVLAMVVVVILTTSYLVIHQAPIKQEHQWRTEELSQSKTVIQQTAAEQKPVDTMDSLKMMIQKERASPKHTSHVFVALGKESWEHAASAPLAVFEQASGVTSGLVLIAGGLRPNIYNVRRELQAWDMSQRQWMPLGKPLELPLSAAETHQAATAGDDFFFIVSGQKGGGCGSGTTASWALHVPSRTWIRLPDLPEIRYAASAAYFSGKLHIVGGAKADRAEVSTTHWVLDIGAPRIQKLKTLLASGQDEEINTVARIKRKLLTLAWTTGDPIPLGGDHAGSVEVDGSWYVIGGEHDHEKALQGNRCGPGQLLPHSYLFRYDFACSKQLSTLEGSSNCSQKWTRLSDLPHAVSHIDFSAVHFEGFIVVFGGQRELNTLVPYVQAYSIADDRWHVIDHMKTGGIKSASVWLQDCSFRANSTDSTECVVFSAVGEAGRPETNEPLPPCVNTVRQNALRLIVVGWPPYESEQKLLAKDDQMLDQRYPIVPLGNPPAGWPANKHSLKHAKERPVKLPGSAPTVFVQILLAEGTSEVLKEFSVVRMPRESWMLSHSHKGFYEILYTLSGSAKIKVGEEATRLDPGSVVLLPPGVEHEGGATVSSDQSDWVVMKLELFTPFEQQAKLGKGSAFRTVQQAKRDILNLPSVSGGETSMEIRDLLQEHSVPHMKTFHHVVWHHGAQRNQWMPPIGGMTLMFGISGCLNLETQENNITIEAGELYVLDNQQSLRVWVRPNEKHWTGIIIELDKTLNQPDSTESRAADNTDTIPDSIQLKTAATIVEKDNKHYLSVSLSSDVSSHLKACHQGDAASSCYLVYEASFQSSEASKSEVLRANVSAILSSATGNFLWEPLPWLPEGEYKVDIRLELIASGDTERPNQGMQCFGAQHKEAEQLSLSFCGRNDHCNKLLVEQTGSFHRPSRLCSSTDELFTGFWKAPQQIEDSFTLSELEQYHWNPPYCIFPSFSTEEVKLMLKGQWIFFLGDSLSEEIALNLMVLAGMPWQDTFSNGFNTKTCNFGANFGGQRIFDAYVQGGGIRISQYWNGHPDVCQQLWGMSTFADEGFRQRLVAAINDRKEFGKPIIVFSSLLHDLVNQNFTISDYTTQLKNVLTWLREEIGISKIILKTAGSKFKQDDCGGAGAKCPYPHCSNGMVFLVNKAAKQVASSMGIPVVDQQAFMASWPELSDGHHCSDRFLRVKAKASYEVVKPPCWATTQSIVLFLRDLLASSSPSVG